MPRATNASKKSVALRGFSPKRSRSASASSAPSSASFEKTPSSTAVSSVFEPQKPSPSCMIASGVSGSVCSNATVSAPLIDAPCVGVKSVGPTYIGRGTREAGPSLAAERRPPDSSQAGDASPASDEKIWRMPQSAAAPSPFPPIADYAFLSNCHTGALIAPDGAIDWLCVPRFDAPSVFGSLLDRGAGAFRFGPFGINHPTARVYEPGTNVLITTWKTPRGWIEVRDALTIGPRRHEDTVTPHTRPPADDDAEHLLVRTVRCLEGNVEVELICEPVFDYGRTPAEWTVDDDRHTADATGAGQTIR